MHSQLFSACSQAQTRILIQAPRALFFHGLTAPKVASLAPLTVPTSVPPPIFIRQGGPQPMGYFF